MRIPPEAIIAPEKLTQYLLVPKARSDKSRFLARAGFTLANPDALEGAIRLLIASVDAVEDSVDAYGTFFTVAGEIIGPNGATLAVVTVWIRLASREFRFVTLKPGKEKRP